MRRILLINPNASARTTAMMVDIARGCLPSDWHVEGCTAGTGVDMILDERELALASDDVARAWSRSGNGHDGVVIAAFADPGLDRVRAGSDVPVVGICESSVQLAARDGRRFGIATVTPDLAELLRARIESLGVSGTYTGIRLTSGDPRALAAHPDRLEEALACAVQECIERDGAEAVVIGGGPLGQAAAALAHRWHVPVIAPIPAAMAQLRERLERRPTAVEATRPAIR